jgi:LacI family repressor for deo operon, udp, cdd, tsx, nupC, and nupG
MMHAPDPEDAIARSGLRIVLGLVPGLGNSFWNVIINAIEDVLIRAGYGVIFGDTRGDPVREAHYERLLRSGHVDGLILFNPRPSSAPRLFEIGLPTTVVFSDMPDLDRIPVFGVDNREAAATMVEYLVSLGHRRIAHIAGPDDNLDAQARLRGYGDALVAAGIAVDPGLIWRGGYSFVAGAKAAQRYLALSDDRPTAIFAASDEIAIGCISALREAGMVVPDGVSVAGFDGIDYSAMYEPPLTTMLQPRAELGRLAAEELVRQLGGAPARPGETRLPCKLVIRQSVAPVGRDGNASRRRTGGGGAQVGKTIAFP